MPQPLPAMAIRAAVVATATAAALITAVPATPPATAPSTMPTTVAAPAPQPAIGPAAAPAPVPAPAPAPAPVQVPVQPVVQATAVVPTAVGSSALNRALSKVGSPYRYGAAGPNAFDCSGLVNWAYKSAGVSLPRTSRAMSRVGTPVSRADLRPGDLVFFYRPVSHVGIYIGNGKIVHASSKKYPVKISDMGRMKFNSARRV